MAKSRKSAKTSGAKGGNRELLSWALQGLEQAIASTRQRLHDLESQARSLMAATRGAVADAAAAPSPTSKGVRKKRKLSADARRRIAEAQKRRWAKARAGKE